MLLQADTKDKTRGELDPDYADLTPADEAHLNWQRNSRVGDEYREGARRIFRKPVSFGGGYQIDPRLGREGLEQLFRRGKRKTA
jgi:hypothetical protein